MPSADEQVGLTFACFVKSASALLCCVRHIQGGPRSSRPIMRFGRARHARRRIGGLSFDVCQNPVGFLRLPVFGNLAILGVIFVLWSIRLPLLCRQDLRFVSVEKVS